MSKIEQAIWGRQVVLDTGVGPAWIGIDADGRIAEVRPGDPPSDITPHRVDDGCLVLPGLVDPHVHINEPGRTRWEGFETATRAAVAGGVTTLVDMPLNSSPVTTTPAALEAKRQAAEAAALRVDVGFHAGVVPGNTGHLAALARGGVLGAKAFLVHSGIDDFPNVTRQDLEAAMPVLTRLGLPLLVHSELDLASLPAPPQTGGDVREADRGGGDPSDPRSYATWLASRPAAMEDAAIEMLLELCQTHGTRLHIVHLASASGVELLRRARTAGLPVTVETCPQYLCLAAEDVPDGATAFKCAPPIRERAVQDALWDALDAGVIDMIVTDHSPAPPDIKHLDDGDFMAAWGGISSLGLALPLVWDAAARRNLADPVRVAHWMSTAPAELVGLQARKGRIAVGCDADLVVFDPTASWTVTADDLHYRHKLSPYLGRPLSGRVRETWLRGERVYTSSEGFGAVRGRVVTARG